MANKTKHDYSNLRKQVSKEIKEAVKEGAASGYAEGIVEGLTEKIQVILDANNLSINVADLADTLTNLFAQAIGKGVVDLDSAKLGKVNVDLSDIVQLDNDTLIARIQELDKNLTDEIYETKKEATKAAQELYALISLAQQRGINNLGENVGINEDDIKNYLDVTVDYYKISNKQIEAINNSLLDSMTSVENRIEGVTNKILDSAQAVKATGEAAKSVGEVVKAWQEDPITKTNERYTAYNSKTRQSSGEHLAADAEATSMELIQSAIDELGGQADSTLHSHPKKYAAFSDDDIDRFYSLISKGIVQNSITSFEQAMTLEMDKVDPSSRVEVVSLIQEAYEEIDQELLGNVESKAETYKEMLFSFLSTAIPATTPMTKSFLGEIQTNYDSKINDLGDSYSWDEYFTSVASLLIEARNTVFEKFANSLSKTDQQRVAESLNNIVKGSLNEFQDMAVDLLQEEQQLRYQEVLFDVFQNPKFLKAGETSAIKLEALSDFIDWGSVKESAQEASEVAIETIRKTQDSNSPSKVAKGLGEDLADGYVEGIEAGTEKVKEAASSIAEAAMDALKEGSKEVNTKVLDFYKEFGTPSQALDSGAFSSTREVLDYLGGRFAEMKEDAEDFSEIRLNNEFFKDLVNQLDIADDKLNELALLYYEIDKYRQGGEWTNNTNPVYNAKENYKKLGQIQELIDANKILQKQFEDSRDEVDRLENEVGELEDRLTGSISGTFAEELKEENIELREELAATRNEADGFLEVLDNLRNRVELLENDIVRQHPGELVDTTRIEEILGKIDELETKVKESSESSKSAIINSEWAERIVDDLQEQIDELKEAKDQFKNAGGELVNSFAEGANTYKENIAQVFGEISDAGLEAIRDNNEAFFTAGRQHGSEYVSGIEDYLTTAGDKVAEAVGRIASETSNINLSKNDIVKTQESSIPEVTKDIEQATKAEQKFELMVINSWQAKQIQQAFYNDVGIKNEKTVKDIQLEAEQLESIITEYREATEAKKEFVEVESSKKQEKIDASASADSIKKESQALDELEKDAEKAAEGKKKVTKENKELKKAADDTTESTNEETEAVKKLATQIDRSKLAEKIKSFLLKNPKTPNDLKRELKDMIDTLNDKSIKVSTDRLNKMKLRLQEVSNEITNLGKKGSTWFDKLGKKFGEFTRYLATQVSFYKIVDIARQGVSTVIELDTALTELRKVSDATEERLTQSFSKSAETARELGQTISDVIGITADWSRLGYDIGDAEELARVTTLFTTVGDNMTAEDASSYLISTLQGYQMAADEAEDIVNRFNNVANNMAIDTKGIGEALQRSAASFNAANTDLSKSIALITATNTVIQNPESVGTLWKTLSARIRGGFAPIYKEIYNPQTCKKYAA